MHSVGLSNKANFLTYMSGNNVRWCVHSHYYSQRHGELGDITDLEKIEYKGIKQTIVHELFRRLDLPLPLLELLLLLVRGTPLLVNFLQSLRHVCPYR